MKNGKYVDEYGTRWYKNDQLHREDGPAVEWKSGNKEWYKNGERHRGNGFPAFDYGFAKTWWVNGRRHREDGPAIEWFDGTKEWWVNGIQVTKELKELKVNSILKRAIK